MPLGKSGIGIDRLDIPSAKNCRKWSVREAALIPSMLYSPRSAPAASPVLNPFTVTNSRERAGFGEHMSVIADSLLASFVLSTETVGCLESSLRRKYSVPEINTVTESGKTTFESIIRLSLAVNGYG